MENIGIFAINNPVGNIPVFISLTKQADGSTKKRFRRKLHLQLLSLFQDLLSWGNIFLTLPSRRLRSLVVFWFSS